MKLAIIIIGIITIAGSVIGTVYAVAREIRKQQREESSGPEKTPEK